MITRGAESWEASDNTIFVSAVSLSTVEVPAPMAALGARSGRLVRQLLTEGLLLAAAGGLLGIVLAAAGLQFLKSFGPANLRRLQEIGLDSAVLVFCAATLATGLLFGLAPILSCRRGPVIPRNSLRACATPYYPWNR